MCQIPDEGTQNGEMSVCETGTAVYRAAITHGSASGDIPECLLRLGLLRPQDGEPDVFLPVPPDVAAHHLALPIERAVRAQQQRLLDLRAAFSLVEALYREEQQQAVAPVRLLEGLEVIEATLWKLTESCQSEFQSSHPGPRPPRALAEALPRSRTMLERGVRQRTLYQHSARSHGPTLDYMEQVHALGGEFRTHYEVFGRVLLFDRSVALIPEGRYKGGHHHNALIVEHAGVVGFLADVFDHAWHLAVPVTFGTPDTRPAPLTDEKRRMVLRLMVEGHTDAAIASRLSMSTRTVANHVKRAAEAYGSRSRAQLAYLLAKSGHLE
ncbi:LuxR family transcriptional regulator [Streptomyces longispororuber]|uniref:LuxR family transcriptional regulator n=1 Tax=Streptomyces longispororuber TaxID=68230 RepID=A0A919A512_9ACTN|nr:LuxR C-terminal-related transcriptional regulator [Streptomyces longispororuber]GHE86316.1 LuxR family transcriptional regulator [Streptomyces longispororuber]